MPQYDRVYSLLDNGDNIAAQKHCDQLLKKLQKKKTVNPSEWQITMGLKGISLVRQQKFKDAINIASEIKKSEPDDDDAIQLCANIYRDSHHPEHIPELYETALKKSESEERYIQTFMAYLRNGDYIKMKYLAMKLYMKYKKYQYLCWNVMCGYYQAAVSHENVTNNLNLARKFMEREKIVGEGPFKLYLSILELLNEFTLISSLLDESMFDQTLNGYEKFKLKVFEHEKNYPKIGSEMMNRITKDDNDWFSWKRLIEVIIEVDAEMREKDDVANEVRQKLTLEGTLTSLGSLIQYINDISVSSGSRAPELAKLELVKQLERVPAQWNSIYLIIKNYCDKFCGKQCTYFDLETYLSLMDKDNADELISRLIASFDMQQENGKPDSVCCQHILPYLLKCFYKTTTSDDVSVLLDYGVRLHDKFVNDESIKDLMKTEPRPWDRHFLLAAQINLLEDQSLFSIMKSLSILELAINKTGFNSDLMLMALNLYVKLNCVSKATILLGDLDVKSILYDSMGYLCFPGFQRLNQTTGKSLMEQALPFYKHAAKDATEQIISSFRNNNFDKIGDMSLFRGACLSSGMRRLISIENQLLNIYFFHQTDDIEPVPVLNQNQRDNRDLNALNIFCNHRNEILDSLKRSTFHENSTWCSFREIQAQQIYRVSTISIKADVEAVSEGFQVLYCRIQEVCNLWEMAEHHGHIRLLIGVQRPAISTNISAYLNVIAASIKAGADIRSAFLLGEECQVSEFVEQLSNVEPINIDEMNMMIESVNILTVCLHPVIDQIKPLWRKNQNKLSNCLKSILASLASIKTQLGEVGNLSLKSFPQNDISETVLKAASETVWNTVTKEEARVINKLNDLWITSKAEFDAFCRK